MLKVAFAGTHGSGKTTLTSKLCSMLDLEPIVVSRPTAVAQKMGYKKAADVPKDLFDVFQLRSLFEQIFSERACLNLYYNREINGFASDRSTIDYLAYYFYGIAKDQRETDLLAKSYKQIAVEHAATYDFIFYLPPNPAGVEDDGRRFTDDPGGIDTLIRQVAEEAGLKLTPVPWMPIDERAKYVAKILRGCDVT